MRLRTALTLAATVALVTPGASFAARGTRECAQVRLDAIKRWSTLAVTRRHATIAVLSGRIAVRPHVTPAHRNTLVGRFGSDGSGLDGVNQSVQAATTCAAAHAEATHVVTDFRVYLLLVPQTHLTVAADTGAYGASRLAAAEPKAAAAIALLPAGEKRTAAQAAYDDLVAQVRAAQSDFGGVGDTVLALAPAQYPGFTTSLDSARAHVGAGVAALGKAVADAERLATLLR